MVRLRFDCLHRASLHSGKCWAESERDSHWWNINVSWHGGQETSRHENTCNKKKKILTVSPKRFLSFLYKLYINFNLLLGLTEGVVCWQIRPHGSSEGRAGSFWPVGGSRRTQCPIFQFYLCHIPTKTMIMIMSGCYFLFAQYIKNSSLL